MLIRSFIVALAFAGATFAQAKEIKVNIENIKFDPPNVEAHVGDKITWVNKDLVPHTATAEKVFDSKSIDPGKTWSTKLKKKGTLTYKCLFHPTMLGTIDVK